MPWLGVYVRWRVPSDLAFTAVLFFYNDLHDYYPAMKEITKSGGWVIRIGDKTMEKLDPMESKLVIYDDKSELFILCERNKVHRAEVQSFGATRKSIQELRLNNFARNFLDTIKSNARIVIK